MSSSACSRACARACACTSTTSSCPTNPRQFYALGGHFSEQYLLAALLTGTDEWEVEVAAQALHRERRAAVAAAIPSLQSPGPVGPSAFWIRRA